MQSPSRFKMLVLPSWYPPYGGDFFREHSLAISENGVQTDVLSISEKGITRYPKAILFCSRRWQQTDFGPLKEIRRWHARLPRANRLNAKRWVKAAIIGFDQYLKNNEKPHLIQVHSSMWAGVAASEIKKKFDIPYVLTEHRGRFTANAPENMIRPWQEPMLREAFAEADRIVLVSQALKKRIEEICPEAKERIVMIPNLVDDAFFSPSPTPPPLNPFHFVCIANPEKIKGLDVLLKAFFIATQQSHTPLQLSIVGEGPEKKKLQQLAIEMGLGQTVAFTGRLPREKVREKLWSAHALVVSSHFESFGMSIIEAMACGLPVIATCCGGPEYIVDKESGWLVPPKNAQAMALAMSRIIKDYAEFDQTRIAENVHKKYGKAVVSAKYLALYQTIISSRV